MRWRNFICVMFAVWIAAVIIYPLFLHPIFHITTAQLLPLSVLYFANARVMGHIPAGTEAWRVLDFVNVNTHAFASATVQEIGCSFLC